ncbi:hypothetical protein BKA63DRAFT_495097 [Paraphoma chrysanthemicola]|nr:hypothetical protein BKA63DRAFT_495097 [Paraphoma chrysanthemicola]
MGGRLQLASFTWSIWRIAARRVWILGISTWPQNQHKARARFRRTQWACSRANDHWHEVGELRCDCASGYKCGEMLMRHPSDQLSRLPIRLIRLPAAGDNGLYPLLKKATLPVRQTCKIAISNWHLGMGLGTSSS